LQAKITPFDELNLTLEEDALSRKRNGAGRKRQHVVVVASLIDKIANLAGIARTCEIFAVQKLILSSLAVMKTDTFQGIAVSSDLWLPTEQVKEVELKRYLSAMKRDGYQIVALEQTDSSESLADVASSSSSSSTTTSSTSETITKAKALLSDRVVLLLGKEREGVPVELLSEVDVCLEIPQFGVIRSLNVHVSAALAIWELTKRNLDVLEGGEA